MSHLAQWLIEQYGLHYALGVANANIAISPEGPGGKEYWRAIAKAIQAEAAPPSPAKEGE